MTAGGSDVIQATFTTANEAETTALAAAIGAKAPAGAWMALWGELGAGKTRFVKGLAQSAGIDPARVASPTYVLLHVYEGAQGRAVAHIDAYRLSSSEELDGLGLDALLQDRDCLVAVEWAQHVADALPDDALRVRIEQSEANEHRRMITVEGRADVWSDAVRAAERWRQR